MDNYKIYPKQFRNAKIPIEKNRCFVIMPFNDSFDLIYGNIKKALQENGYVCNRADEILGSKPIMNKVLIEILKAHYIIADLTGESANVFYELGISHSFKDSQNILMITQDADNIPFDIRHINNIIYDPSNMFYLTSSIIKTLDENRYLMGFHEALQQKNIISFIHDNQDDFVNYLLSSLQEHVQLATEVLTGAIYDQKESDVESFINKLQSTVLDSLLDRNHDFLKGILSVYFEAIAACSSYSISDRITNEFLYDNFLSEKVEEKEIESFQTDMAIILASGGIKLNIVMGWIIDYFSRSKTATIDLNRYKLERFLMTSNDPVIDDIIVDSIFHKNSYIREHLSDIIGEKKIYSAGLSLTKALRIEENYFTAVSLISAIGKLNVIDGDKAILNWIDENFDQIKKTKQYFVLKHGHIALSRLSKKQSHNSMEEFDKKYGKLVKNYFIL